MSRDILSTGEDKNLHHLSSTQVGVRRALDVRNFGSLIGDINFDEILLDSVSDPLKYFWQYYFGGLMVARVELEFSDIRRCRLVRMRRVPPL